MRFKRFLRCCRYSAHPETAASHADRGRSATCTISAPLPEVEEGLDFVEDAVTRGPIAAFNVNDEDAAGRVSSLRQARLWRKSGRVGLGSSQMPRFARPSGQRRRRGPRAWLSRSFTSPKYPFLRRRWMRESLRGCNSRVTSA